MLKNFRKKHLFTYSDLDSRLMYTPLWELGIKGEGVTVAVLDTGINHISDLEQVITIEKDFTGENNPKDWKNMHGTKITSAIHGIAPKANIANYKVLSETKTPDRKTVCQAIRQCIADYPKVQLINLSLEFTPNDCSSMKVGSSSRNFCILCSTVNEAVLKGIFVVAAAGNRGPNLGTLTCPGLAEEALTVMSTDTKKEREWWENLSVFKKTWYKWSGQYGQVYGTSFSAAWVSGLVALLLSAFDDFHPIDIIDAIIGSVDNFVVRHPKAKFAYDSLLKIRMKENELEKKEYIIPRRYLIAKQNIYSYAFARKTGAIMAYTPSLLKRDLDLVTSYIWYLIRHQKYKGAINELNDIKNYIEPNEFPSYSKKVYEFMTICNNAVHTK